MEEKRIKQYSRQQKILLVGEGDFSFALCLAKAFGSPSNIVATSLDSKDSVRMKYSRGLENLKELENLGCTVLHGVNAHTMRHRTSLQHKLFDRIVFNFPHAGFFNLDSEHSYKQIKRHKKLVRGFMRNGREMVRKGGEMHVTHKTAHPFCEWEIEDIATEVGLYLYEEVPFQKSEYKGYHNKRGDGDRCDQTFPVGMCSTFILRKFRRTSKKGKYVAPAERMMRKMSRLQVTVKDTEEATEEMRK